jgi:hypothetical protein
MIGSVSQVNKSGVAFKIISSVHKLQFKSIKGCLEVYVIFILF